MNIGKETRYTEAFKRQVVWEVETGRLNKSEASQRYGILGHSTISKWCRTYGSLPSPKHEREIMDEKDIELLRLQNEIKALRQELDDARYKNVVLETLVDVAERELKIPIRKKYGAKRSGK